MGSVLSPWDKAPAESLVSTTGPEHVHARSFANKEQATLVTLNYIERLHDRVGIHSALGWSAPLSSRRDAADSTARWLHSTCQQDWDR